MKASGRRSRLRLSQRTRCRLSCLLTGAPTRQAQAPAATGRRGLGEAGGRTLPAYCAGAKPRAAAVLAGAGGGCTTCLSCALVPAPHAAPAGAQVRPRGAGAAAHGAGAAHLPARREQGLQLGCAGCAGWHAAAAALGLAGAGQAPARHLPDQSHSHTCCAIRLTLQIVPAPGPAEVPQHGPETEVPTGTPMPEFSPGVPSEMPDRGGSEINFPGH